MKEHREYGIFPKHIWFFCHFLKTNLFDSSWDGTLAFKKIRGPIWRPEDQFGGISWWSDFPIYRQMLKSCLSDAMSDQTLPKFETMSSYGPCHPPGQPQTSPISTWVTKKCWTVDFPVPCKTKSCQSSTECLRMLRALPPDTPRPPQFQLELWQNSFLGKP